MAPKRRSATLDDFEPVPKKAMYEDHFSVLPTELLEKIFGYLAKENKCTKVLTETCTRFESILSSRLGLCLDFDRIKKEGYPIIRGSYSDIKIIGSEIESKHKSIRNMLEASSHAKTKSLTIGEPVKTTKIKLQTLLLLLGMPNIAFLKIYGVNVIPPRSKVETMPDAAFPELSQLKCLYLGKNLGLVLSAFKKKTDLTSLFIQSPEDIEQMRSFISSQKELKLLVSDPFIKLKAGALPQLHTFYLDDSARGFNDKVFDFAPNLQSVVLLRPCSLCSACLVYFNSSPSIKTIRFESAHMPTGFDVSDILPSYPSLTSIDCPNLQWRKK